MTVETRNPGEPDSLVARLKACLDRQHDELSELAALCPEQRSAIDDGRMDDLLDLLARRQRVVDRLSARERELNAMHAAWKSSEGSAGEREREEIDRRLAALSELAARVSRHDESDRERLSVLRDDAARRVAGVSKGRGAVGAYGRAPESGPRFQDREG